MYDDKSKKINITSDCMILIFPGIRYSRHDDVEKDKTFAKKFRKQSSKIKKIARNDGSY
jgi:hypothetical protein